MQLKLKQAAGTADARSLPEVTLADRASDAHRLEILSVLLGYGAHLSDAGLSLVEACGCSRSPPKLLSILIRAGRADVNAARGAGGLCPLTAAVGSGRIEIVRELLWCGADINLADGAGRTPLQVATTRGKKFKKLACYLLHRGATRPVNVDGVPTPGMPTSADVQRFEAEAAAALKRNAASSNSVHDAPSARATCHDVIGFAPSESVSNAAAAAGGSASAAADDDDGSGLDGAGSALASATPTGPPLALDFGPCEDDGW